MNKRRNNDANQTMPGLHFPEGRFIDLLSGLLSDDAAEQVFEHLVVCPACEDHFQALAADRNRLRASRSLPDFARVAAVRTIRSAARAVEPAAAGSGAQGRGPGLRWRWVFSPSSRWVPRVAWMLGAAAVVTGIVLLTDSRPALPPASASLPWLPSAADEVRLRGPEEPGPREALAEGLAAYDRRDFQRAAAVLQGAPASGDWDTIRRIYLGSALALNGQYPDAVSVLRVLPLRSLPSPWGTEGRWVLCVALRASGFVEGADSLLHALAEEPGEVGERARRGLRH